MRLRRLLTKQKRQIIIGFLGFALILTLNTNVLIMKFVFSDVLATKTIKSSSCNILNLHLIGHHNHAKRPECIIKEDWGSTKQGYWHFSENIKKNYENINCFYRTVERIDDFKLKYSPYTQINENFFIKDQTFEVKCTGIHRETGNASSYECIQTQILRKENFAQNKIPEIQKCERMNILLFSYDSVSRVSWQLRLKKTSEFMFNIMKFKIMKGMNIIGEGTPAFMIPVLTGKIEEELPSALKTDKNGKYVDEVYPFIWNELNQNGYATLFNEDAPEIAVFNYRMRGMKNDITTHYMRAYQQRLAQTMKNDLCVGAMTRHQKNLNIIDEFYREYKDVANTFVFSHLKESSHSGNEKLHLYDDELYEFLKKHYHSGTFNNTVIFLYSDHGPRFNSERAALQGYLEERMPFFSVYLPDGFKKRFPDKYKNLLHNSEIIASPFDVHPTLRELTCLEPLQTNSKRARSLLSEFPKNRTCDECEIASHYCICVDWIEYDNNSKVAYMAAASVVERINEIVKDFIQCASLKLDAILAVGYSKERLGFNLLVKLQTLPNRAVYEARVHYKGDSLEQFIFSHDLFEVHHREISRLNAYGSQASCFFELDSKIDLRKFCYCLNPFNNSTQFNLSKTL